MDHDERKRNMHDDDDIPPEVAEFLERLMASALQDPRDMRILIGMADMQEAMDQNPILHHNVTSAWPNAVAFMN